MFLFAAALPATQWIVDQQNGPGTHFTTIGAAVAAAVDGDTIVVRTGTYVESVTTGKALTILGSAVTWAMPLTP